MAQESPKCSTQRLIAIIWTRPKPNPNPNIICDTRPNLARGPGPGLCRPLALAIGPRLSIIKPLFMHQSWPNIVGTYLSYCETESHHLLSCYGLFTYSWNVLLHAM
jgi:hypothetical protein